MTHPIAIGTVLEVLDHNRTTSQFIAAGYNENDYLCLTKKDDAKVGMTLHPAHALRIALKGGEAGIKVLDGISLNDITVRTTEAIVDVPTPIVPAASSGTSKKDRALAIKAANPEASRKALIQMFVEQLGMTPAGASTYASMKA